MKDDVHNTNMLTYNRTGADAAEKTMTYQGNRMAGVSSTGMNASGSVSYGDIGRVVPSDVDVVTQMAYEGTEVQENGQLRMLLFTGGYVDFSGSEPRYCWYTHDHLGSVRAVSDAQGNVFADYAYRPYGEEFVVGDLAGESVYNEGVHEGGMVIGKPHPIDGGLTETYSAKALPEWQPYRFSGKESLTRVGLDLYDFGARMYSPSNARWMTMDPLCEKFYDTSPYVYCNGNPVNYYDPDGRNPIAGALIGAALDFSLQVGVHMMKGEGLVDAVRSVDYTSVATAGITGAISPSSLLGKAGMLTAIVVDAAVDITPASGVSTIFDAGKAEGKTMGDAVTVFISGALGVDAGSAVSREIAAGLKREATSTATATMTKEVKQNRRMLSDVANNKNVQAGEKLIVGNSTKLGGEAAKSAMNSNNRPPLVLTIEQGEVENDTPPSRYYFNPTF